VGVGVYRLPKGGSMNDIWVVKIIVIDPSGSEKMAQNCIYRTGSDAYGAADDAFRAAAETELTDEEEV
jgi:hypothetical protein